MEYDELPQNVKNLLDQFGDDDYSYEGCRIIIGMLNQIGWDADFDLSGALFDFKQR